MFGSRKFALLFVPLLSVLAVTLPAAQNPERRTSPAIRSRVEPTYTEPALRAGITGTVTLFVKVDKNGVPAEVKVIKWTGRDGSSSEPLGLDKAAIEAVRQWRFYPGVEWGKPKPFSCKIEMLFDFRAHPEQLPGAK